MHRFFQVLLPVALVFVTELAMGCGPSTTTHLRMYAGNSRPESDVAILWFTGESHIAVTSIDEKQDLALRCDNGEICRAELLPGPHVVGISHAAYTQNQFFSGFLFVDFVAQAGKGYFISVTPDYATRQWSARILEMAPPAQPVQPAASDEDSTTYATQ